MLASLRQLHRETPPAGVTLHLIVDESATHEHAKVKSWTTWHNQRHRKAHGIDRVVQHFTPASSSWMNLVERFFRDLARDVVRQGSFASVREPVDAMAASRRNATSIPSATCGASPGRPSSPGFNARDRPSTPSLNVCPF